MVRTADLDAERIISEIERVLQSNEAFEVDENFILDIIKIRIPQGQGYVNRNIRIQRPLKDKKSVVMIKNKDNLCMAHALVVARAKASNDTNYKSISDSRPGRDITQRTMAEDLCCLAVIDTGKLAGLEQAQKSQDVLTDYEIVIFSRDFLNGIIHAGGQKEEEKKRLYRYHSNEHFDAITSMTVFLGKSYYCTGCEKGYSVKCEHICQHRCRDCFSQMCKAYKSTVNYVICNDCRRSFGSQGCFLKHIQKPEHGRSICEEIQSCPKCEKQVSFRHRRPAKHHCGLKRCTTCKQWIRINDTEHLCFISKIREATSGECSDECESKDNKSEEHEEEEDCSKI